MTQYVSYIRVSTQKQGASGLGLEAQRKIISDYIEKHQGELISEFTEVQSGTGKKRRVEVYKAISEARRKKATLIVAKLDRLARDVEFISAVQKMDIDIVFIDFPKANKLVIGIISLIAEYESSLISRRTKDALSAKKARGHVLGNPNIASLASKGGKARAESRTNGQTANKSLAGLIAQRRSEGLSYSAIADEFNNQNFRTTFGKEWQSDNIAHVFKTFSKQKSIS